MSFIVTKSEQKYQPKPHYGTGLVAFMTRNKPVSYASAKALTKEVNTPFSQPASTVNNCIVIGQAEQGKQTLPVFCIDQGSSNSACYKPLLLEVRDDKQRS